MNDEEPKSKHIDQETAAAESKKLEEPKTSTAVKPKEEEKKKNEQKPTGIGNDLKNMINSILALNENGQPEELEKLIDDKCGGQLTLNQVIECFNYAISTNILYGMRAGDVINIIFKKLNQNLRKEFLEYLYRNNFSKIIEDQDIHFGGFLSVFENQWENFLEEKEKDNKNNVCKNDITGESKFLNIKRGRNNETLEQINENLNNKNLQKVSENVKTNNPISITTETKGEIFKTTKKTKDDEIKGMIVKILYFPTHFSIKDLKKLLVQRYEYKLPLDKAIEYFNYAISINSLLSEDPTMDIVCAIFTNLKGSPKYNNAKEQAQGDDRKKFLEYLYDNNFSQIMKNKNITFDKQNTFKDRWETFLEGKQKKPFQPINSSSQVNNSSFKVKKQRPAIKLIINDGNLVNEEKKTNEQKPANISNNSSLRKPTIKQVNNDGKVLSEENINNKRKPENQK